MIERAYVEIGNLCNLKCSFCHKTKRAPRQMTAEEFSMIAEKLRGRVKFLYLHVLGEPLCHPHLDKILSTAGEFGFRVCITTNGTLLAERGDIILSHSDIVHKVSISVHAPEGDGRISEGGRLKEYLFGAVNFAKRLKDKGIFTVFRLWNLNSSEGTGKNSENVEIEKYLFSSFPLLEKRRERGIKLDDYIFLEYDGVFTWPSDSESEERNEGFCHGLVGQIGILADGTVVPCCLDAEGEIPLGNIFRESFEDIMESDRAKNMLSGLKGRRLTEKLCRKCTFSRRFK
jgi:radical SAM protein with 4Fe4S-binding SPASM domain